MPLHTTQAAGVDMKQLIFRYIAQSLATATGRGVVPGLSGWRRALANRGTRLKRVRPAPEPFAGPDNRRPGETARHGPS